MQYVWRLTKQLFRRRIYPVAFLCLILFQTISGQFYFDKWTTDNGLPQNTVGAILQTRDGYLWLATLDGLVRFDGVKFKVFTIANSPGIISNRFRLLHETPDGALWIGTEEFGVTRYKDGKFKTFTTNDGLPSDSSIFLATDADNNLIVKTISGFAKSNGERFVQTSAESNQIGTCAARGGGFWKLDKDGLKRLRNNIVDATLLTSSPIKIDYVPSCYEDSRGAVWLLGNYGEIFVVKNNSLTRLSLENVVPLETSILFAREDRQGIFWFGTNRGLLRFENNKFELYDTSDGLSDKSLLSFYEDREGLIWLGTSLGGLNLLNRRAISVLTTKDGLAGNGVYPIYEARDGAIWVGANGLTRLENGKSQRFVPIDDKDKFPTDITAIAEDDEGRVWLGASGRIGFLQNGKYMNIEKFIFPEGSYTVWTIHQDRSGAIWFGTDKGLVKMSGTSFQLFTMREGLPGNDIKIIHEDSGGRLWLGTYGGLSILENGKFKNFTTREGLSSDRVRALYEDKEGTIWLGTYDGGLNRFRDGKFTSYSTKNGLYSDGVFQILPDDEGYFWMSSNQGIYRVRKQELEDLAAGKIHTVTSEGFGKRDGLLNTECNGGRQPAGVRARDGRLWFPTQEGVAVVDPRIVKSNPFPTPVLIESVTIDRQEIELAKTVHIQPNQTNLEIAYTGLSFIKPEQVRFRYKLEGLNDDWIDTGTRRTAYFSYLPPGKYTFRVMAANSSGVWNEKYASVEIVVHPAFWQTWWFMVLSILTVAGIAAIIIRSRFRKLRRERVAQEAFSRKLIATQEQERKRIAGELHDGLGQNLLVIKNWALLALQKKSDDAPVLQEISETASHTLEDVRRIAYNLRPYQIDDIGLTKAIEGMITRIEAASSIRFTRRIDDIDGLFPKELEINLFRIVQECVNNVVKHSEATEASVSLECAADSLTLIIEDNGRGFDIAANGHKKGLGITGLQERARMLGGELTIQSEQGKGTKMVFRFNFSR